MIPLNFSAQEEAHLLALIKWIYDEAMSAGGDGDFLWYSTFHTVKKLFPLVDKFNNTLKYPLDITLSDNDISWSEGQTTIHITNNELWYKNAPSWQQGLLKY